MSIVLDFVAIFSKSTRVFTSDISSILINYQHMLIFKFLGIPTGRRFHDLNSYWYPSEHVMVGDYKDCRVLCSVPH